MCPAESKKHNNLYKILYVFADELAKLGSNADCTQVLFSSEEFSINSGAQYF